MTAFHSPSHNNNMRAKTPSRHALSLIEVMISLTITAMLLTAVAAAFSASTAAIENNDQFFRACQSARVALNLMLTDVRRSTAVAVPSSTQINLITADSQDLSFAYAPNTSTLKLIKNATAQEYVLARNVKSFSLTDDTAIGAGGVTYVARISISITVEIADNQITLSGSAAPRRVQTYKD